MGKYIHWQIQCFRQVFVPHHETNVLGSAVRGLMSPQKVGMDNDARWFQGFTRLFQPCMEKKQVDSHSSGSSDLFRTNLADFFGWWRKISMKNLSSSEKISAWKSKHLKSNFLHYFQRCWMSSYWRNKIFTEFQICCGLTSCGTFIDRNAAHVQCSILPKVTQQPFVPR